MHADLRLVAPDPTFAARFAAWWAEPGVSRFNPVRPMDEAGARRRIEASTPQLRKLDPSRECRRFILLRQELVGTVALDGFNAMMGFAEVSYHIAFDYRGRGIGTAAVRRFVEAIFAETPIRRLIAMIHEQNSASRRLIERVGFVQEGLLREHYLVGGQPANEVCYGLLRSEWEG
jgi:ribosomal-protein-alanine N-acetyltransferase